mgnify:CR=1 FL=1
MKNDRKMCDSWILMDVWFMNFDRNINKRRRKKKEGKMLVKFWSMSKKKKISIHTSKRIQFFFEKLYNFF